jgi:hypothetical protein
MITYCKGNRKSGGDPWDNILRNVTVKIHGVIHKKKRFMGIKGVYVPEQESTHKDLDRDLSHSTNYLQSLEWQSIELSSHLPPLELHHYNRLPHSTKHLNSLCIGPK